MAEREEVARASEASWSENEDEGRGEREALPEVDVVGAIVVFAVKGVGGSDSDYTRLCDFDRV